MESDSSRNDLFTRSVKISIHALRMESDAIIGLGVLHALYISIHALRMESDLLVWTTS